MKAVRAVAQQTRRQGARLQAARIILEHEVDLVKYENPQEQRFRHTVDVPNEMTVRVIDGNA